MSTYRLNKQQHVLPRHAQEAPAQKHTHKHTHTHDAVVCQGSVTAVNYHHGGAETAHTHIHTHASIHTPQRCREQRVPSTYCGATHVCKADKALQVDRESSVVFYPYITSPIGMPPPSLGLAHRRVGNSATATKGGCHSCIPPPTTYPAAESSASPLRPQHVLRTWGAHKCTFIVIVMSSAGRGMPCLCLFLSPSLSAVLCGTRCKCALLLLTSDEVAQEPPVGLVHPPPPPPLHAVQGGQLEPTCSSRPTCPSPMSSSDP